MNTTSTSSQDEGNVDNRTATEMTFHNVCYTVEKRNTYFGICRRKERKKILDDVSGCIKPGLNAILGPSGSGKTSLLDVLACRKDPKLVSGRVLLDKQPLPKNFRLHMGYVTQKDLLIAYVSAREALWFCANLRLPASVKREEKEKRIEKIIEDLNLKECADCKIGNEAIRGLSGGEKKRVSIALELVLKPRILFLDEPTTGLDAATAWSVIFLLKSLSKNGHTIVCSIHQPRYSIYKFFDRLTLLANGGVVYHGTTLEAVGYFEEIGYECDADENPANFLLDVIKGELTPHNEGLVNDEEISTDSKNSTQLKKRYLQSSHYSNFEEEFARSEDSARESDNNVTNQKIVFSYQTTAWDQFKFLARRTGRDVFRNPHTLVSIFCLHAIVAIILGLWFFQLDESPQNGFQNRLGLLFVLSMKFILTSKHAVAVFHQERAIFTHEYASGYYRVTPYYLSKIFADLMPKRTAEQITICCITYWMAGLRPDVASFFTFVVTSFLLSHASAAMAYLIATTFEFNFGQTITQLIFAISVLFSGALVNMNTIAAWLSWLQYLSIARYGLLAFCISELKGRCFSESSNDLQNVSPTSELNSTLTDCMAGDEFLRSSLSIGDESDVITDWLLWRNHFALACICMGCHVLAFLQLSRVKIYS